MRSISSVSSVSSISVNRLVPITDNQYTIYRLKRVTLQVNSTNKIQMFYLLPEVIFILLDCFGVKCSDSGITAGEMSVFSPIKQNYKCRFALLVFRFSTPKKHV